MAKKLRNEMVQERLLQMPEGKPKSEEDDDIISQTIGEFGRWQLKLTFLLSLVNIPCTWHIFAPVFHAYNRDTWCARPEAFRNVAPVLWRNCTQPTPGEICWRYDVTSSTGGDFCDRNTTLSTVECTDWEFDGEGRTIISEFNLVCDKENWVKVAEMMFLAGVAVGGLVCGFLSDKYGRKKTLLASILIQSTLGTIIAISPWFIVYVILRAALGFISVSVVFSGFVLAIELVGGSWRTVSGISYLFPVSLSYVALAGIGYLVRDWRHIQLAMSLPNFLFLGLWWILPESPRWLLALGRTKEVMKILKQAARENGRELPDNLDKQLLPASLQEDQAENVHVIDLFRTAQMRKKTLLLFIIWFTVYLLYYGLVLNLEKLGGNLYLNAVIQGLVEIPAVAFSILMLVKGNRRWPLALTLILTGFSVFATVPMDCWLNDDLHWLSISFTMLGKLSISSSNAIMPVFTAELYPTTIRNIGVGAANVSAGIALMLVPYLFDLKDFHPGVPMAVLGLIGLIGGISVLGLPETGSGKLVDTLKEEHAIARSAVDLPSSGSVRKINNNLTK